ncbi:GNAT family N-acetyltransferase [Actinomadura scrupuli]|uniref:GNAT family N-acetyltransferase n=1 Tax=Actinomadura scrupuli TaxID=559629 RepID=UPI003D9733A4
MMWGRRPWWDGIARCADGTHQIWTGNLLLRTLMSWEFSLAAAGGSDPEAQRWLGWRPDQLMSSHERKRLLAKRVRRVGTLWLESADPCPGQLLAIDPAGRRYAGLVSIDLERLEMGGWLASGYRGRGLGTELFAGGARFAHRHLGLPDIWAGAEPANKASSRALASAGFRFVEGPREHRLSDGRVIPAAWFHHGEPSAARCETGTSG